MCHWVAGALLPAAGMAGRQHPLCVAYHCKRRAMFGKLAGVVFGLTLSKKTYLQAFDMERAHVKRYWYDLLMAFCWF